MSTTLPPLTEARSWTVTIPWWKPVSVNRLLGKHWGSRSRLKQQTADMIAIYAKLASAPKATCRRRVSLFVTIKGRGRLPDPDNLLKITFDALKQDGLLIDDSPRWCELGTVTVERGKQTATTITLEDV